MPVFVLTVLKVVFLALLYFFVYRALRSVALDVRSAAASSRRRDTAPARPREREPSRGKPPRALVVTDERNPKGRSYRLDGTLQIGRSDSCDITLQDTYASSFHARVFSRDGEWYVEDLGSTNGTYLNQRRVTSPSELHAGDRVKIGKTVLELRR